jgi:hypothetical protein
VSLCWLKILSFTRSLSFDLCEVFAFSFLCSDNEDPKKGATTAPSAEATASDEPSFQEVVPVVKSPKAPAKRVSSTRGSKRLKKAVDVSVSLDTHRSVSSSDYVSSNPGVFALFSA